MRYVTPLNKASFMNSLRALNSAPRRVAFHTAEIYGNDKRPGGGGLGVLSGDWLQECADQSLPIVAVSIAHSKFQHQTFTPDLVQSDVFDDSGIKENPYIVDLGRKIDVDMQGRKLPVSLYGQILKGKNGGELPVILMSTQDCGEQGFERITERLYPGTSQDPFATLGQEILLGIGGVKALKELGVDVDLYHFNDGHPALGAAQILKEMGVSSQGLDESVLKTLREKIVYTSHTLVGAAADMFHPELVSDMIRDRELRALIGVLGASPVDGRLKDPGEMQVWNSYIDMMGLAMFSAGRINAVSRLNGDLLKKAFPIHAERTIAPGGITNAVHPDWAAGPLKAVYDRFAPGWEEEPSNLRSLSSLSLDAEFRKALWQGHSEAKKAAADYIASQRPAVEAAGLDPDTFAKDMDPSLLTIGFARRVAGYKRHDLLVHDINALAATFPADKPVQFIFAGKAHPMDSSPGGGKYILQSLLKSAKLVNEEHGDRIRFAFLPNYDVDMARIIIPGVDVWLNNPIWGEEASGTSTMDAVLNAVPLATTVDGCVPEMMELGDVGWPFGMMKVKNGDRNYKGDSYALYSTLASIRDLYYHSLHKGLFESGGPSLWVDKMISCVSEVTPYFLTARMVSEYRKSVWDL